jgi:hypothetical protein
MQASNDVQQQVAVGNAALLSQHCLWQQHKQRLDVE